jgi:hypothetical protein
VAPLGHEQGEDLGITQAELDAVQPEPELDDD